MSSSRLKKKGDVIMIIPGTVIPTKYPTILRYVSARVPLFPKLYPKRYQIYEELCTDPAWAARGIQWGDGPKLAVCTAELAAKLGLPPIKEWIGCFAYATPDRVWIADRVATKYEKNPAKYGIGLQCLLMHEMIHWARYHAGAPRKFFSIASIIWAATSSSRLFEAGDSFEQLAYGRDMSSIWDTGADENSMDTPP